MREVAEFPQNGRRGPHKSPERRLIESLAKGRTFVLTSEDGDLQRLINICRNKVNRGNAIRYTKQGDELYVRLD